MQRTCKICGETKLIDEFTKAPTCKYGRAHTCLSCTRKYGRQRWQKIKPKPKEKPTEKVCCKCGKEYPRTEEYFFIKITKQKNANGEIKEYKSFRWVCKQCHAKLGEVRRINKRCIELQCNRDDYKKTAFKNMAYNKLKFKELKDLPRNERAILVRRANTTGKLMLPEEYHEYLKGTKRRLSIQHRKYEYGNVDKITSQMSNGKSLLYMSDARIALIMGLPVKKVPKEMIEVKRTLILLKREAGLTHSTKKICQIKN